VRLEMSITLDKRTLEEGYRAMAADTEREAEAQEWCNALIGDVCESWPLLISLQRL